MSADVRGDKEEVGLLGSQPGQDDERAVAVCRSYPDDRAAGAANHADGTIRERQVTRMESHTAYGFVDSGKSNDIHPGGEAVDRVHPVAQEYR